MMDVSLECYKIFAKALADCLDPVDLPSALKCIEIIPKIIYVMGTFIDLGLCSYIFK